MSGEVSQNLFVCGQKQKRKKVRKKKADAGEKSVTATDEKGTSCLMTKGKFRLIRSTILYQPRELLNYEVAQLV